MQRLIWLLPFLALFSQACSQPSTYGNWNAQEFDAKLKTANAIVLDVRTAGEFNSGHLDKAVNIDFYARSFAAELDKLDKSKAIFVYCATGYRSGKASQMLTQMGFGNVHNLKGGIMVWQRMGLPIVRGQQKANGPDAMDVQGFATLISSDQPVLIDFYAPWCAPCKQMMPMVEDLKKEYAGKVKVVKINVDASQDLASQLQLQSVPFFAVFRKDQLMFKKMGTLSKTEITTVLDKLL